MTSLDLSTFLTPGTQYTISIAGSTAAITETSDAVLSALATNPLFSQVSVARSILDSPLNWDITFVYAGDGSDVVANAFGAIQTALEGTFTSWDFISCTQGASGSVTSTQTSTVGLPSLSSLLPSSSGLWAIVILVAIGVFLFSGGANVLRGLTKAAA